MLKRNVGLALMLFVLLLCIGSSAFALSDEGAEKKGPLGESVAMAIAISAGFCIAVAAAGGAIGQSKALSSALEGIARNPGAAGKVMTPMIIGLAMIESLVIYALVISLMLVLKL